MRLTNITNPGAVPASPDTLAVPIPEPAELEEFLTLLDSTFQVAQATYLQDLKSFKANPRESLLQMADIYDEFAMALLGAGLMTSRNLALNLRQHIPSYLKKKTFAAMERQDAKRTELGLPLTDKDELIALAQKEEKKLLTFEAELRAAGAEPEPRVEEAIPTLAPQLHIDKKRNSNGRQGGQDRPPTKLPNGAKGGEQLCHRCNTPGLETRVYRNRR